MGRRARPRHAAACSRELNERRRSRRSASTRTTTSTSSSSASILSRVEGAYYFRPSVDYDFIRNPNGQKFGGGAAIIWSRASEFIQTPGHKRDLGVELDLQLYYQAKDGSLNDDPNKMGGFFTMLQYGVFFPLGGLDYLPGADALDDGRRRTGTSRRRRRCASFLGVVF